MGWGENLNSRKSSHHIFEFKGAIPGGWGDNIDKYYWKNELADFKE